MQLPEIKSLTIKQMKELREIGADLRYATDIPVATDKLVEYVTNMHPEIEWDDVPYNVATSFACKVFGCTVSPNEDLKN